MAMTPRSAWAFASQTSAALQTPVPGTPRQAPSGMTPPPAKRQMDSESFQVALTGQREMSHDELTAAFYNLNGRMEREERFSQELREAVIHNAEIMDQV